MAEGLKSRTEVIGAAHGLKLGQAWALIRMAVTGRTVGLPLFESLQVLGRERTLAHRRPRSPRRRARHAAGARGRIR